MQPDDRPTAFPLFKGATRPATMFGVPTVPLLLMVVSVAACAMLITIKLFILLPVFWLAMHGITKNDPRAFRIWWLWMRTKLLNRNKRHWKASSYTPRHFDKED